MYADSFHSCLVYDLIMAAAGLMSSQVPVHLSKVPIMNLHVPLWSVINNFEGE